VKSHTQSGACLPGLTAATANELSSICNTAEFGLMELSAGLPRAIGYGSSHYPVRRNKKGAVSEYCAPMKKPSNNPAYVTVARWFWFKRQTNLLVQQPLDGPKHRGANQSDHESQQQKLPVLPADIGVRRVGASSGWDHDSKQQCGLSAQFVSSRPLFRAHRIEQECQCCRTNQQ
jgi:hypothetical protein